MLKYFEITVWILNLDFSIPGKLWLSNLQEPGALIGNTDEFSNTLAAGLAPNTILFGVFQSISGYGGKKIVAEEWRLVISKLNFIYSEKATKFLQNLHLTFDYSTYSQKLGGDFAKFCGLLRIYEL